VKAVSAKLATDFPSLGSSIDLDRVQTIMESMGSKLSPGAQQLMDMVRCQQKVSHFSTDTSPVRNALKRFWGFLICTFCHFHPDLTVATQMSAGRNTLDSERLPTQQNAADLRNDLKVMGSLHMQQQAGETPNLANPQVLIPFLQNLCTQVNHLRLRDGERHLGKSAVAKEETAQSAG
uniref:Uncharacterized protein n=1 Tax=Zonotrichia albicollis TaxID=44394 RepID=A0A8D2MAH7_ZONAL